MNRKPPYNTSAGLIAVTGHFGSGKTNVAVALALALSAAGRKVSLVDLDTVNPYFRAADAEALMRKNGIRCINPQFANTNVDVPSLGAEIFSVFNDAQTDPNFVAVLDVGGDNGSAALGQYKRYFDSMKYDMLFVASRYRPLTETAQLAADDLREVEFYSRLKCTHIVNNSNLGNETTLETVEGSFSYCDELCRLTRLPEAFTSVVDFGFGRTLTERHPDRNFFFISDTTKKLF